MLSDMDRGTGGAASAGATAGLVVRKIVWSVALVFMGYFAIDGSVTISIQTGAPQQAAAGAIACFHIIVPYVIARGIDALTRGR